MFPALTKPVSAYFPLVTDRPPPDTFEIGLVLGGTVSAACYTAGVLDFLLQALDAWTVAKAKAGVPNHKVTIKVLAGTSGGGITSVLLARILGSAFQPCSIADSPELLAQNPLYDTWVNQVDMRDLLQVSDLTGTHIPSLLCADKIQKVCDEMPGYTGAVLGTYGTPARRDYVEPWLPVILTLTNVPGIPYLADFRGMSGRAEYFIDHADHIRFRVDVTGAATTPPPDLRDYEVPIASNAGCQPWSTIIRAARGTSAFPGGLPPQTIARDPKHYLYRYAILDSDTGSRAEWMRPAWSYMIPVGATAATSYEFLCVDGGCFNNEPTEYARQYLAGLLGHNERRGELAQRAIVLVDPFSEAPASTPSIDDPGIFGTLAGTLTSLTTGTRFETADLDLFTDENVFSRFLVTPVRDIANGQSLTGGAAIASSRLGAFGGFLSGRFRAHDFFLGRRNCQQFLRNSFMLPANNKLFSGWLTNPPAGGFVPIIPLMPGVSTPLAQPDWPKGEFDPNSIHDLLEQRINKIAGVAARSFVGSGWLESVAANFIVSKLGGAGTDQAIKYISGDLTDLV